MNKKLRLAAWSGIIIVVATVLISILNELLIVFGVSIKTVFLISTILWIVPFVFSLFFIYGFVKLGEKHKNRLLQAVSWIGFVAVFLWAAASIAFLGVDAFDSLETLNNYSEEDFEAMDEAALKALLIELLPLLMIGLGFYLLFAIFGGALSILAGIALIKMHKKVKYAKVTGILKIISGATYIIIIGFLIRLVAYVFEIVLLFEASKK